MEMGYILIVASITNQPVPHLFQVELKHQALHYLEQFQQKSTIFPSHSH